MRCDFAPNIHGKHSKGSLHSLKQTAGSGIEAGLLSIRKSVSNPNLEMWSDHSIPFYHHPRFFKVIIDLDYWKNKNPAFPEDAVIWFTDGTRADSVTGSGIFGFSPNRSLSFPLGKYATVFRLKYTPSYNPHVKL
jgi:hypothetical protein